MDFLALNPYLAYLFVFVARVIDVSLGVFRLLLLTRGYSIPASILGFFEVTIFMLALGTVFAGGMSDPWKLFAYAAGFATGNLVGMTIEEKLAVGYVVMQIFPCLEHCDLLLSTLRNNSFGVTTINGEGKSGPRQILNVTVKRNDLPKLLKIIDQVAPDTFYNTSDIRSIRGGVFPQRKAK